MSLNLCLDQLLVDLVESDRIAALTALSRDAAISPIAGRAARLPVQYGSMEEILRLSPDLVLANSYTRRATVRLLKRLDVPVLEMQPATDFDQIRRNIRRLAEAVGRPARGARLTADFDARLAALRPPAGGHRIVAAPYYASHFSSGGGTLVHASMRAAGLRNLAAQLGKRGTATLPLEVLILSRPDLVVLSHRRKHYRTISSANLVHPALQALLRDVPSVSVPERLWLCGTPRITEAVARLARARARAAGSRERPMTGTLVDRFRRRERLRRAVLLAGLAAAVLAACVVSLSVGASGIGAGALLGLVSEPQTPGGTAASLIIWEIRLPRVLLAMLVGAALGLSGAVLQGYLRNPLAEPGLIGVSPGAALGAALAIATGAAQTFALALPLSGLAGALIAAILVLGLAGSRTGAVTLILAGVAVTSFFGALTALTVNLSPNPFAAIEIIFWMLGSLADRSMDHVALAAPFVLPGCALLFACRRNLDALALGEEVAANVGVDLKGLRIRILFGTALAVGAATAIAGTIGFVGLVVPHLLRPLVAERPGRLLLPSMIGGAILVLLADTAARLAPAGGELNLGVLTALVGAPLFFHLVWRSRKGSAP